MKKELVIQVISGDTKPRCTKKTKSGKYRKHTPIVSEAQRRLFGAVASGTATKAKGLSKAKAKKHLKEVKGKKLPEKKSNPNSDFLEYVNSRKKKTKKGKG